MAEWNPLLVAIAFKRVEIVRYFTHELKISLRLACQDPKLDKFEAEETASDLFGAELAIINHDLPML